MDIWKKTNIKKINISKVNSDPFNNSIWKEKISTKIKLNIKNLKVKNSKYFLTSSPLPLIILGLNKKKISIADYGSGDQEVLFQLINNKIDNKKFKIDSIEVPEITKLLKSNIKKKKYKNIEVNFLDNFNHSKKYDFIHISNSLQYNLDWKNFLKKIIQKKPKFVILNNLTSGNYKTYITEQRFYDKKLPYIFFNENEVINYFKNYRVCRYLFLNRINDEYQKYPQKNFKKKERLGYPKTLVLIRN